jgi:membrane complex biogenesis BtpA family protein
VKPGIVPKLTGVIHLAALPGSPRATAAISAVAADAADDARVLEAAGYDAVIVENFGDAPFLPRVGAVTVSAMTLATARVRDACPHLPLGVNVLRNDAAAALAVAAVVGAEFIRVNVHVGARVTDQGLIEGEAGLTLRAQRVLGGLVSVWADVDVKHSVALGTPPRPAALEAADAEQRGLAAAILVTGEGTGRGVDEGKLRDVYDAVSVPVYVASGATVESLRSLAAASDGVVVGSALRRDGRPGGRVDPDRAREFARAFREAYSRS